MTKIIFLLRHSQSAGKQTGQDDYDRELTPVGEQMAIELGKNLKRLDFQVDLILASAAQRSVHTFNLINQSLNVSGEKIQFNRNYYEALMAHWLVFVHDLPEVYNRVLLIGHNPWLSMLAGIFIGKTTELTPCELIGFEFNVNSWKEIQGQGKIMMRIKPESKAL